jgi:hypothetical protein
MIVRRRHLWTHLTVAFAVAGALAACEGDTIVFPGDDGNDDDSDTVTVTGNVDDITPLTSRDIVVFAYNIDDNAYVCPCPGNPVDPTDPAFSTRGKAAVIESGETTFTLDGLGTGAIGLIFLLDEAGDNADGEIDPGDPVAILDDVDCELDDIDGNITVTLKDVDLSFAADVPYDEDDDDPDHLCNVDDSNAPIPGRARADLITQEKTDSSSSSGN